MTETKPKLCGKPCDLCDPGDEDPCTKEPGHAGICICVPEGAGDDS